MEMTIYKKNILRYIEIKILLFFLLYYSLALIIVKPYLYNPIQKAAAKTDTTKTFIVSSGISSIIIAVKICQVINGLLSIKTDFETSSIATSPIITL